MAVCGILRELEGFRENDGGLFYCCSAPVTLWRGQGVVRLKVVTQVMSSALPLRFVRKNGGES